MSRLFSTLMLLLTFPALASAQLGSVPYTFSAGTTIQSAQVNAMFSDVYTNALNRTGGTMTGTLTAQQVTPASTGTYDLGTSAALFRTGYLSTALVVGAATTSGVRVDLESGTLALREGDDSAYAPLNVGTITSNSTITGTKLTVSGVQDAINATYTVDGNAALLNVRNASAGTAATAGIFFGNDATSNVANIRVYSSSYTTSGLAVADSLNVSTFRAGGLTLAATNVAGVIRFASGSGTANAILDANGNFGVGITSSLAAKLHVVSTTEQARLAYNSSNYTSFTVSSSGGLTLDAVGGGSFTFSDAVTVNANVTSTGTIRANTAFNINGTAGCSGTPTAATSGIATTCSEPVAFAAWVVSHTDLQPQLDALRAELALLTARLDRQ